MTYVAPGYIQHNPVAADGRDTAIAALEPYFASQPNAIREVQRIIVDGNLAVVHLRVRARIRRTAASRSSTSCGSRTA